jgi:PilZ domain
MNKPPVKERRRLKRRNISYYLLIKDNTTNKAIGHLVDISPIGLLMDSRIPIQLGRDYDLHLEFLELVAGKTCLEFVARSIWCRTDSIQPDLYNAGFEITKIATEDIEVLKLISEKYGARL